MKDPKEIGQEEHEEHLLAKKARKRLEEIDPNENIPFDEACSLAGWKEPNPSSSLET